MEPAILVPLVQGVKQVSHAMQRLLSHEPKDLLTEIAFCGRGQYPRRLQQVAQCAHVESPVLQYFMCVPATYCALQVQVVADPEQLQAIVVSKRTVSSAQCHTDTPFKMLQQAS